MDLYQSNQAALHILQHAIALLFQWANVPLPCACPEPPTAIKPAIETALQILGWNSPTLDTLELLFDRVTLTERQLQPTHYVPLQAIADEHPLILYPLSHPPDQQSHVSYRELLQTTAQSLSQNWENLSFLSVLLEKFAHCVSFGQPNVALLDVARTTAAIASALAASSQTDSLSLVSANLSGIQNFIYTISSDGALKSLRARSFYLELVTEEVAQQLLTQFNLPRTNIIYAGGGNLYLIAPNTDPKKLQQLRQQLNRWLFKTFQGKIFLSLDAEHFQPETVTNQKFRTCWNALAKALNRQKTAKFRDQIDEVLEPQPSYEACRVCHRDDTENLKPLKGEDSPLACSVCREMFDLGDQLFKTNSIVRSHQQNDHALHSISFKFQDPSIPEVYYHLFERNHIVPSAPEAIFLINDWNLDHYQFQSFQGKATPLLLGNYRNPDRDSFMTAAEFAEAAIGIKRIGYLRMDVDRLGQIFANGLGEDYSLPRLAGLSRQMSYFFKTYLNELAEHREQNFLAYNTQFDFRTLTKQKRRNLLFIYAGGDDVFVSGAWNEVTEFSFDVYQSFRAYTGKNPDITLSAGVTLETEKFPLYQAAESSGEAEKAAKNNDRDSFCLFNQAHKWDNWLGSQPSLNDNRYLEPEQMPELLGVLPFVEKFLDTGQLQGKYPKSFIRNLLVIAQLREQKIAEVEKNHPHQTLDVTYYLHLPKLAYALSRLPASLRNAEDFTPIRRSLLSPLNSPYFRAIATWTDLLTRSSNP
jgi:CRISPR-associated protein Csm1